MAIDQIQIKVQDLAVGMFVSKLDRPWSETPFSLQGFYIRVPQDIQNLKSYCSTVYIDVSKGRGPVNPDLVVRQPTQRARPQERRASNLAIAPFDKDQPLRPLPGGRPTPIEVRHGVYPTTVPLRIEAARAEKIVATLKGQLTLATRQIVKGRPFDYPALQRGVEEMVGSVLRCPDAMTWLLRLRRMDRQSHDHSLRSALWAVQYARFVGMAKDDITHLCLGTLLKDIGKVKLSKELLRKSQRTPEEEAEYRQFVSHGVEMLRATNAIEPKVIAVVRYHCERLDGSGFPEGITGNRIPLLARIAGIATVYDAISNPRESQEPVAPSKAVSMLYGLRSTAFQDDLVVTFIQSIGIYPSGTLVELNTGDLGVVLDQNPESRLTPRVAVLNRWQENLNGDTVVIDLREQQQSRELLIGSGRDNVVEIPRIAIARDLEPTGYDIDFEKITQGFLMEATETLSRSVRPGLLARLKERLRV